MKATRLATRQLHSVVKCCWVQINSRISMKRLVISNLLKVKCCCGGDSHTCEKDVSTLVFDRAASEFEALRLETEASGKRPKAFMLTIGNLAMRQARAQYSCNFLACAGYEVVDNLGFETVEAGSRGSYGCKS